MKNSIKLRTLVSLSFIVFLLPFLRTCSDRIIESPTKLEEVETLETVQNGNITNVKKYIPSKAEILMQKKLKKRK